MPLGRLAPIRIPKEVLMKDVISTEVEKSISQYLEDKDLSTALKMTHRVK